MSCAMMRRCMYVYSFVYVLLLGMIIDNELVRLSIGNEPHARETCLPNARQHATRRLQRGIGPRATYLHRRGQQRHF